jgi:hypothetical protein
MFKKTLLIILALILLLIVSILAFAPSYANKYINENGKELTKRKIHIDNIDLNIFSGKASIDGFKMYEDDDSTIFIKFDTFFINVNLGELLSDEILVQEFELINPLVNLSMENGVYNFESLLSTDTTAVETTPKDSTNTSFVFDLNNLNLKSGVFNYSDNDAKINHNIKDLDLIIKHIAFDNTTAKMGLDFKLGQGGIIKTKIAFNTEDNSYILDVDVEDLNLNEFLPYLQKDINIKDMQGVLYSDLKIDGTVENPGKPVIKGTIGVKDFKLTDNKDLEFFDINELRIKSEELSIKDMNFVVDTLLIDGVYAQFELYNNSNSVERLFYKNTKEVVKKKVDKIVEVADSLQGDQPVNWGVKHLVFINSKARFIDYSLKPDKFDYSLSNIRLVANDIRFGNNVKFDFSSTAPKGGKISSEIITDPGNPEDGSFDMFMENVDSKKLSPYFVNYFAYPIKRGKFNFSLRSTINDRYLDSRIIIDSYSLTLGDKRKNVEAQSSLPIKTALVIASDKNKRINFDVGVKGDIDDPNFKIGKIVFNTIMKNLGKVIASPGRLLSKGVGVDENKIKKISFEYIQYELGPAQTSQLSTIVNLLKEKNPLQAHITLHVDKEDEIERLIIRRAKTMYFLKKNNYKDTDFSKIKTTDRLLISEIKINDTEFGKYLSKKTDITYLSNKDKCKQLFSDEEINSLFHQLNQARIKNVTNYLSNKEGILYTFENKIIYDRSVDKPYVKFKYSVGEE